MYVISKEMIRSFAENRKRLAPWTEEVAAIAFDFTSNDKVRLDSSPILVLG